MTSWFDLLTLDAAGPEDEKGIKKAGELISGMIDAELKQGIKSERILLGGFSQGGGLSVHTGLRYPKTLAGILALSCWLPIHKEYPGALSPANKDIPILQCHGDQDQIVPFQWGEKSHHMMKAFNNHIEFKVYKGMAHSSCDSVSAFKSTFIVLTLSNQFTGTERCERIHQKVSSGALICQ